MRLWQMKKCAKYIWAIISHYKKVCCLLLLKQCYTIKQLQKAIVPK